MDQVLLDAVSQWVGSPVLSYSAIGGGDISRAYKLTTKSDVFFCKVQSKPIALDMFQAERKGLDAIRNAGGILAPRVYHCEQWQDGAVLIMEHIDPKRPSEKDMSKFGRQLAEMHQHSSEIFGWDSDNYIGSLPQRNTKDQSWVMFYIEQRLSPQFDIARSHSLLSENEIPSVEKMKKALEGILSDVKPSLLHGDLWGGNYLISAKAVPYLIDPAVYYGHNEVDIAMSQLFGGFSSAFYDSYERVMPFDRFSEDRIRIYQLYYLLVHLNLFGRSYYTSVMNILKHYF